mmetsp:Transcript_18843/g.27862  ORF Transcript_18843/g.27862 Transcript_18843/m.27862 type:complete len:523 (+) Transcript_18843:126-1694(+)|eukprot:CAMPEP_0194203672 /NCGR_PEP_ID=MMETSP0156-20130528/3380_1 /TAXON_ID=33649 /ORGANISM="Thalassionema nitzschioides, Strain L26-B" /LENGTH=522 /DNA_ID=CAMNT_0038929467 /DNA_START=67 /DNA_END=1635 /DNA_ORIENTATION=-
MRIFLLFSPLLVEALLPSHQSFAYYTSRLLSSKESQKAGAVTPQHNSSMFEFSPTETSNGKSIERGDGRIEKNNGETNGSRKITSARQKENISDGKLADAKTKTGKQKILKNQASEGSSSKPDETGAVSDEGLTGAKTIGIGGKGGVTYDVNKLKTNFVQKAVAAYKDQLWELLGTPDASQAAIEEKIAALCQANPVSTTTDSNLLEGKWEFVFSSKKPAYVLLDPDRFSIGYEKGIVGDIVGTTRGSSRLFILESLEVNQNPYVVDEKPSGIFDRKRHYSVSSLTRTSLGLDLQRCTWNLFGIPFWSRQSIDDASNPVDLKILYVDSDICISVEQNMNQPFTIYTRSDAWITRAQQLKRKWRKIRALATKLKIRSRVMRLRTRLRTRLRKESTREDSDGAAWIDYDADSGTVRLIKLGDFDYPNDPAWEGEADPFVHLPADERQQLIKSLEIGEIQAIGKKQQKLLEKMRRKKLIFSRERTFNKPTDQSKTKIKSNQIENNGRDDGEKKMKFQRQKPFNKP